VEDDMPPGSASAEQLRQRARLLRKTAATVSFSSALDLFRRAGDDVWRGPTPSRCLDDLVQIRTGLLRASDDLVGVARVLDQLADLAETQARTAAIGSPP
jgi:hypothetical protein